MKKFSVRVFVCLCTTLLLFSCQEMIKMNAVTAVLLSPTSIELVEGESFTLIPTIVPSDADNQKIVWNSSNPSVVTVTHDGVVSAISPGNAVVTVVTEDGGFKATCDVTVKIKGVVFSDKKIKEICVAAFDTDDDGELTYQELESVKDLSKITLQGSVIKSFDELQYFTSVKTIPSEFFADSSIESVILPEGLEDIMSSAFANCLELKSIKIPNTVEYIDDKVFAGCKNLEEVILPDNLSFISAYLFSDCESLLTIDIPQSVYAIDPYAFNGCKNLTNIILPPNLKVITQGMLSGCSGLTTIDIPKGVTEIGGSAFATCVGLKSITIPDRVKYIGVGAFATCVGLESIIIPNSVTVIGAWAFTNCTNLTEVTLSENITSIEEGLFFNCPKLSSVTIPVDVKSIGYGAFTACTCLDSIKIKAHIPPKVDVKLDENEKSRLFYVPYESIDKYIGAQYWSKYADSIVGYDFENDKVVD